MDEVPRTRLQPRTIRVIRELRVAAGAEVVTGDSISVGTAPDNTLVLSDPAVSRYHLELTRTSDGVAVIDLGSRNGTWVDSIRIDRATVPPGTRLRAGDTTLAVDDAGSTMAPPSEAVAIPGLIGDSEPIREVARLIGKLARVDSSVLIHGETGSGKEVVAHALHEASPRRDKELVVVDCGSLPATLIASILFGHEKGAFTGADQRRTGAFERADGGTILLDEIGELPLEVQPALLGALERRSFTRVGGSQQITVDVRILAATHRDLRAEVNAGRFRADLYYRLAVAKIVIPPLRERPEDVEPLIRHFVQRLTGRDELGPLAAVLPALQTHPWTGNVRELRNVVETALVMGAVDLPGGQAHSGLPGGQAHAGLPGAADAAGRQAAARTGNPASPIATYRDARAAAVQRFEADYLRDLIERATGNASEAARLAKMDRPYLLALLRKHGLRPDR